MLEGRDRGTGGEEGGGVNGGLGEVMMIVTGEIGMPEIGMPEIGMPTSAPAARLRRGLRRAWGGRSDPFL